MRRQTKTNISVSKLSLLALALIVVALIASSCGGKDFALERRALDFFHKAYDLNNVREFLTPVLQQGIGDVDLNNFAVPGMPVQVVAAGKENLEKLTAADISTRVKGKWGQVTASVNSPAGILEVTTLWVKVNGTWYLFAGTDGEKAKYGKPAEFI